MLCYSYSSWLHWTLMTIPHPLKDTCFTLFDTWWVLLDEECMPSIEVVNWLLKLLEISLGDVWGLPMNLMPSFSIYIRSPCINSFDGPPQLGAVDPVVYALNELSLLFSLGNGCRFGDSLSTTGARSYLRKSSRSSIMARIFAGTCFVCSLHLPVGIWWEAALNSHL